jgi:hypothetical protein
MILQNGQDYSSILCILVRHYEQASNGGAAMGLILGAPCISMPQQENKDFYTTLHKYCP